MFEHSDQASLISESVTEIQITIQPCKGINLTTRHMWFLKIARVAIVHNDYQSVKLNLSYPTACLPRDTSVGIYGWPTHYPLYIPEVW
jgi:hypothetical protein